MMKKNLIFICSFLLTGLIVAQTSNANKQQHETNIIVAEPKSEKMDSILPLQASPNTVKNSIYADKTKSADERTRDLIKRLTFEEKFLLTGGVNHFQIPPIERLGLRPIYMADASQGVKLSTITISGKSTSFPAMLPLASTWNKKLAKEFGKAIGEECKILGVDILLGPGINMQRLSVGGRNYEYMGEDPLLTSVISSNYILGMENTGILSCPKHFILNDQEFCRHISNSIASQRTLREIYLPPWKAAIEYGKCSSIMTGNNLANGAPAPANKALNADLIRKEYGFRGIAMTDWQNSNYFPSLQHLILPSGQTLMMPTNSSFSKWIYEEIEKSPTRKAEIEILLENMIYPTLYVLFEKGVYDRYPQDVNFVETYPAHKELARRCAEEAIVLLKNENNILPVSTGKKIIMYGKPEIHSGEGSGYVDGYDHVNFAAGFKSVYKENFEALSDLDEQKIKKADIVLFSFNKRSGEGRDTPFEAGQEDLLDLDKIIKLNKNVIVLINSSNVFPFYWLKNVKGVLWCYFLGQERGNALANIVSGKVSPSGKLPFTIERKFADSPAPTFNHIGNKPFWQGNNNYKGYWLNWENNWQNLPNKPDTLFTNNVKPFENIQVPYNEGILIGYRWYDYHKIPVVFPFGFGLSYSMFKLSDLKITNTFSENGKIELELNIQNSGSKDAQEVVQIYVSKKQSNIMRAPKELKDFRKVSLKAGEKTSLKFTLDKTAFSYWDETINNWNIEKGDYVISAGNSSANLILSAQVSIN